MHVQDVDVNAPPPGARGGQGIQVAVGKGSIDAGNRPRLVARTPSDGKTMAFDFVDISGSTTPAFVEHVEFTMTDADHHMEHWTFVLAGDQCLRAHFDLTRGPMTNSPRVSRADLVRWLVMVGCLARA